MSAEQSDIGFLLTEIIVCWYEILRVFVLNSSFYKTKFNYKKEFWGEIYVCLVMKQSMEI